VSPLVIGLVAFLGVSALVGGAALLLSGKGGTQVEQRLDLLTGSGTGSARESLMKVGSLLTRPLDDAPRFLESLMERFGNFEQLFEQADTSLTIGRLVLISGVLALAGAAVMTLVGIHPALIPVVAIASGILPTGWLLVRRGRRLKAFGAQLPDALEMMARVLRAGQSLGFGFSVVSTEMSNPISREFSRVFEEQNLGIPLEESLHSLCDRVPNLDLRFFTTAVILQRQTGGDLAEILDKIGSLIRDRFRVWGQIQALTGEGRLSGVVLLAMPFLLFIAVYQFNPGYVSVLFTDPMGKKMLAGAIFMQVLGAWVIRRIVNIKV
jgi:tight adherence protein B